MRSAERGTRSDLARGGLMLLVLLSAGSALADEPSSAFKLETLSGRVVYLAEALEKRTGVSSVTEAKDRILAIETDQGELIPLLEDIRGRAFRKDERLRAMHVELLVRRYAVSPVAQIIRVFEVSKEGKFEVDYWCEVCAIAMFEQKDCECCQEPNILRRRKAEPQ